MADEMKVLVASYPTQLLAEQDWSVLQDLVNEGALLLDDAAVLVKNTEGQVAIVRDLHKPVRKGLLIGAVISLFTPVGLVVGLAGGALGGKLASLFHTGVSQATLRDLGEFLETNSVCVVIAGPPAAVDGVRDTMKEATGFLAQTLDADGQAIRQAVEDQPDDEA